MGTRTKPRYFIIFCWLPRLPGGYEELCGGRTQALMERLRREGHPFYARAMVPDTSDELFPAKFAFNQTLQEGHDVNSRQGFKSWRRSRKSVSEADLFTVDPTSYDEDSDEDMLYDIFNNPPKFDEHGETKMMY